MSAKPHLQRWPKACGRPEHPHPSDRQVWALQAQGLAYLVNGFSGRPQAFCRLCSWGLPSAPLYAPATPNILSVNTDASRLSSKSWIRSHACTFMQGWACPFHMQHIGFTMGCIHAAMLLHALDVQARTRNRRTLIRTIQLPPTSVLGTTYLGGIVPLAITALTTSILRRGMLL